jgi:hypothetical protein
MKKILLTVMLALTIVGITSATPSTEAVISKSDGLHVAGATTDRIGLYGVTPVAQQAATVTPYVALQNLGAIASGSDYTVQHKTVALTAANLIAMYATPVAIVAAQGSGKSIVVTRLIFTITRTATSFANGGAAIFQYGSTTHGGGTQALDSTLASTVLTGAAGTTVTARNGAVISDLAAATIQNAGLYISNATGAFDTGTGTATVDVWYVVQ